MPSPFRRLSVAILAPLTVGCSGPVVSDSAPIAFRIAELRGSAGRFSATVRVVNAAPLGAKIELCESFERKSAGGWSPVTYGDYQCLDAFTAVGPNASVTVSLDGLDLVTGDTVRFAPRYRLGSASYAPGTTDGGAVSPAIVVE